MKKAFVTTILLFALTISLVACGSDSTVSDEEEAKEYVPEDEVADALANPDKYAGKYIVLTGQVFNTFDTDDADLALQAYHDLENYKDDFVIYCSTNTEIAENDYFEVDGKISGSITIETILGEKRNLLCVEAETLAPKSHKTEDNTIIIRTV